MKSLAIVRLVAEHGGFSPVARLLNVEPSTIGRAVGAVEATLETRLFERSTRAVVLTEAGERWLGRVGPALDEIDAARDAAVDRTAAPSGVLRLTASAAFGHEVLAPLLPDFRAAFPALELEMLLTDATLDLVADRIDLAIRLAPEPVGDVVSTRLMRTRYRVVASPGYVADSGPIDAPTALSERDCLLFVLPEFRRRWRFRRDGGVVEAPVRGSVRMSNALALRDAARRGLGPALLADWLIQDDLRRGALIDLLPAYEATATTFDTGAWALYPSRAFLPTKTRRTLDFLKRRLPSRRAD